MKRLAIAVAAAAALSACTYSDGTRNPTATGATLGVLGGAVAGGLIGGGGGGALIGGVLGAGAGAALGGRQERQTIQPRYY